MTIVFEKVPLSGAVWCLPICLVVAVRPTDAVKVIRWEARPLGVGDARRCADQKGSIGFQPVDKSVTSGGDAITNGKYSIPRETGLPVGKYRVTINAPKPGTGGDVAAAALPGEAVPVPQELIPPEWNAKSEQFIEVTEKGPYVFNFDVKSKGK